MRKAGWILIIIIVLAGVIWGVLRLAKQTTPQGEDRSVFHPLQSRDHIAVGAEHPAYSSNPPTSGWHYELTARKRFYEEPVPDEYLIHNLEHGDIWIAYHPRIPLEIKEKLKTFAFAKIVIAPRETNDTDIALVAWERLDAFNLADEELPEERIRNFIKRYRNMGPERIPAGAIEATFN